MSYNKIYVILKSELGGSGAGFSPTPKAGNRFRFRFRLRCVRASERSCVSARESPSVARARQRNLWVRPPSAGRRSELKVRAVWALTDDMRSLSLNGYFLEGGRLLLLMFRACFGGACVVGSWSWTPGFVCPRARFCMCFKIVLRFLIKNIFLKIIFFE